ncbi:MAG: sporulation membrane protein YtaF [Firmicutes bacterium]|nr:sporulation membrane protein YtaF [Bacillota bacterium]
MQVIGTLLLAVAVSLDGLMAGVAYGMRRISIPFVSLLAVNVVSALMVSAAMFLGRNVGVYLGEWMARLLGGGILIALGCAAVWSGWRERNRNPGGAPARASSRDGGILRLLSMPEKADLDRSGSLSLSEALPLGIALAMDALGAGFGAGVVGFWSILMPVFVGVMQFIFVSAGMAAGRIYLGRRLSSGALLIPGGILILLGILRLV